MAAILNIREIAKMAVIKHGVGPREELTNTLPEELAEMEEIIMIDMVGNNYYEYYRGPGPLSST